MVGELRFFVKLDLLPFLDLLFKYSVSFGGRSPLTFKISLMWFVYILKCSDFSYYTGCTNSLTDRIIRHNKGEIHYTKDKLPVELITYITFTNKYKAYEFEKYLKSGSGMAFRNKRLI